MNEYLRWMNEYLRWMNEYLRWMNEYLRWIHKILTLLLLKNSLPQQINSLNPSILPYTSIRETKRNKRDGEDKIENFTLSSLSSCLPKVLLARSRRSNFSSCPPYILINRATSNHESPAYRRRTSQCNVCVRSAYLATAV